MRSCVAQSLALPAGRASILMFTLDIKSLLPKKKSIKKCVVAENRQITITYKAEDLGDDNCCLRLDSLLNQDRSGYCTVVLFLVQAIDLAWIG